MSPFPESPAHVWHALAVRPSCEVRAANSLSARGFPVFSPVYVTKRQWTHHVEELETPLFPGVVFTKLDSPSPPLIPVLQACLAVRGGFATPLNDVEVEIVRKIVASGLDVHPWPFLNHGQRVLLSGPGPLNGVHGILVEPRVLVASIAAVHRSVAVELTDPAIEIAAFASGGSS